MGRYMTVVLKGDNKNDLFISLLNEQLSNEYGANTWDKFNPWDYLQWEADYINEHPDGKKQLPHFLRPITKEQLSNNFFWLRHGEFSFKLSGGAASAAEARDAVAICKWIEATKGKYIDKKASDNYDRATVAEYLNHLYFEEGYDLIKLWQLPTE
ncbi:hypothetical protein GR160_10620 [Flavobacterium sp. Sd200]|uniref:hypothetical protein n=1 Tax=Flavobacterium sp. Sd200 TaxID=2692211 RepID=UPI00136FF38F|nr:hypothetical protein [Flavobacterium sp. Sd200]MXN91679.1 hypothetical protein [Flavobacterium sp. Sd200]